MWLWGFEVLELIYSSFTVFPRNKLTKWKENVINFNFCSVRVTLHSGLDNLFIPLILVALKSLFLQCAVDVLNISPKLSISQLDCRNCSENSRKRSWIEASSFRFCFYMSRSESLSGLPDFPENSMANRSDLDKLEKLIQRWIRFRAFPSALRRIINND